MREQHGETCLIDGKQTRSKELRAWASMKNRCHKPNGQDYHYNAPRGIVVCDEWRNSFKAFLHDMGRAPSPAHTVDRIDNDGNYDSGNCRWATRKTQARNRNYVKMSLAGAEQIRNLYAKGNIRQVDLAKQFNVSQRTISLIVRRETWVN